jgi:DNA-binding NarL/FixJ family response regulator
VLKRILVVDDHDVVRQGVRLILRNQPGLEIIGEAENGSEAIDKILALKPDLVVLDITMPVKSGLEVLTEVNTPAFPHKPKVLILTMHDAPALGDQIARSGGNGYVIKSHAARDLARAIKTILGGTNFFAAASAS